MYSGLSPLRTLKPSLAVNKRHISLCIDCTSARWLGFLCYVLVGEKLKGAVDHRNKVLITWGVMLPHPGLPAKIRAERGGTFSMSCAAKIDVSWGKSSIEENNLNHSNSRRWYCILGEESRYFVHMMSMDIDAPVSIAHRPSIPQSSAT
jgi:hypothetical protein